MKKLYININDYQKTGWALGRCQSLKAWREDAMAWSFSDNMIELYNSLKNYKIKNAELIDFINDFWDLEIVEATPKLIKEYENIEDSCYSI